MSDQPKPPLWRVIVWAWCQPPQSWINQEGCRAASVLRALADWLVPESSCRPYAQTLYHEGGADTRLRLRNELLTEADRAERGE